MNSFSLCFRSLMYLAGLPPQTCPASTTVFGCTTAPAATREPLCTWQCKHDFVNKTNTVQACFAWSTSGLVVLLVLINYHLSPFKDGSVHAYQACVCDGASAQGGIVPHSDIVAYGGACHWTLCKSSARCPYNCAILQVAVVANPDLTFVT